MLTPPQSDVAGVVETAPLCPHFEDHTPRPEGYLAWHAWAKDMAKSHHQLKCIGCGRYSIWVPKAQRR
jgi:hypothetical protein